LEAVEVVEIMSWLPEVEDLITVLDRAKEGRDHVTYEEDIECSDGAKLERGLFRATGIVSAIECYQATLPLMLTWPFWSPAAARHALRRQSWLQAYCVDVWQRNGAFSVHGRQVSDIPGVKAFNRTASTVRACSGALLRLPADAQGLVYSRPEPDFAFAGKPYLFFVAKRDPTRAKVLLSLTKLF
jgi:hypothetical protein